MMYALVHYPAIDTELIDQLRRKYDPQCNLIRPHLTLIFPLPESIGETALVSHIGGVLQSWKPFPLRLHELEKSWDDYLFLTPTVGRVEFVRLYEELYTGFLAGYKRDEVLYVPHVTLGVFRGEVARLPQVREEANALNLAYRSLVDQLDVVKVNDEQRRIIWSRKFLLET